jgi:hypothetical protein
LTFLGEGASLASDFADDPDFLDRLFVAALSRQSFAATNGRALVASGAARPDGFHTFEDAAPAAPS